MCFALKVGVLDDTVYLCEDVIENDWFHLVRLTLAYKQYRVSPPSRRMSAIK